MTDITTPASNTTPTTPAPIVTTTTISMNTTWRIVFAIGALLFFSATVIYLIIEGNPQNSLHQSALSWSFLADLAVLAALGFGQVLDIIPYIITVKKT